MACVALALLRFSAVRRVGRVAWGLVACFLVLLLVRLLQGARLGAPPDPTWGLRVLWHHGSLLQWLALSGVLVCAAAITWAAGQLARRDDSSRPLSWGSLLFFAVGVIDAIAGAWLHFRPASSTSFAPWIVLAARCAVLAVALPALFMRLRGLGTACVPPGLVLSLLGLGLYLSPLEATAPTRESHNDTARLAAAGLALSEARENSPMLLDIQRRLVEAGNDGVTAILDVPGNDIWWTWHTLLEFGPDAVPALVRGLARSNPMARKRAVRALASRAHDLDVARAVLPLLSDRDSWARCFAARFYSDGSGDENERTAAVLLPEAFEPLRALLRDPASEIRQAAVDALRHQALHAAWPDLRNLLRFEPEREVREEAHESLVRLMTPDALRLLLHETTDKCSHSRKPTLPLDASLASVAIDLLHLPMARRFLASNLYQELTLKDGQIETLIAAATSKEVELRQAALSALSRIDDPRAIELSRAALHPPDAQWVIPARKLPEAARADRMSFAEP